MSMNFEAQRAYRRFMRKWNKAERHREKQKQLDSAAEHARQDWQLELRKGFLLIRARLERELK